MRHIAHIVNPVIVGSASDLSWAQPATFETMRIAREFAAGQVQVELIATQYPEDASLVPGYFRTTPPLDRSILDVGRFRLARKYPFLRDVLDRLYQATDAEYLVYTNVDIAVLPYFYLTVNALIDAGYDALVINRRTISDDHRSLAELPLMYAEVGAPHEGHDCFVFKRGVYPEYKLGEVCIGIPYVGRALLWNLFVYGEKFHECKDHHLTFHIGPPNQLTLGDDDYADYRAHNKAETAKVKAQLEMDRRFDARKPVFSLYPLDFELVSRPRPAPLHRLLRRILRGARRLAQRL